MHVCRYAYILAYTHRCLHICLHICIGASTYGHIQVYMGTYMHVCWHNCTYADMYVRIHADLLISSHICVYASIHGDISASTLAYMLKEAGHQSRCNQISEPKKLRRCKHNFGERGSPRTFASPFSPANILKSSQVYEAGIWNRLIQILRFGEEGGGVLRACGAPEDARRHTQDRKKLVRSAPVAFRKALNTLGFLYKIELCTNLGKNGFRKITFSRFAHNSIL